MGVSTNAPDLTAPVSTNAPDLTAPVNTNAPGLTAPVNASPLLPSVAQPGQFFPAPIALFLPVQQPATEYPDWLDACCGWFCGVHADASFTEEDVVGPNIADCLIEDSYELVKA